MRVLVSETTWASSAAAHDLSRRGFLVTRSNDGEETLLYVRDAVQDVVFLDDDLGDIAAERVVIALRALRPGLPVIVLAKGADRARRAKLFGAGADHVTSEQPEPDELAARIRALSRRAAGYTTAAATLGDITIDFDARRVAVGAIPVALTPAEYEFVEHLALRRRHVVPRDEIMTHLYGLGDAPDAKILDVHAARIRKKLSSAGALPGQLRAINGRGFLFDGADPGVLAA